MDEKLVYTSLEFGKKPDANSVHAILNGPSKEDTEIMAFIFRPTDNCVFTRLEVAITTGHPAEMATVALALDDHDHPGLPFFCKDVGIEPDPSLALTSVPFTDERAFVLEAGRAYWIQLNSATHASAVGWFYCNSCGEAAVSIKKGDNWSPIHGVRPGVFNIWGIPIKRVDQT